METDQDTLAERMASLALTIDDVPDELLDYAAELIQRRIVERDNPFVPTETEDVPWF